MREEVEEGREIPGEVGGGGEAPTSQPISVQLLLHHLFRGESGAFPPEEIRGREVWKKAKQQGTSLLLTDCVFQIILSRKEHRFW